jgi:hypothetical protein
LITLGKLSVGKTGVSPTQLKRGKLTFVSLGKAKEILSFVANPTGPQMVSLSALHVLHICHDDFRARLADCAQQWPSSAPL